MRVTLGWWNTSLSPASKEGFADDASREQALDIIKKLLENERVDVLGLCEVSTADIAYLSANLSDKYDFIPFNEAYGRSRFDLGLIVRASLAVPPITSNSRLFVDGKWNYALGVEVQMSLDGEAVVLFLSHWPSRRHKARNAPDRTVFGTELRRHLSSFSPGVKIVMMGDYNDEPFDDSLCSYLKASRDRSRVSQERNIYYNPFWRKLGAHAVHKGGPPKNWAAGTYYHANGRETKWYTFDQMMFSEPFLKKIGFQLNEKEVRIVNSEELLGLVRSRTTRFDHLPIVAVIER